MNYASDLGKTVPEGLKFGIIVTVAVFWADFLKSALKDMFNFALKGTFDTLASFIIAVSATVIGYLILLSYRKIVYRLKEIEL